MLLDLGALGKLQGLFQVAPLEEGPLHLVLKQHFVGSVIFSLFITICCKYGDTARMLTDEQCHGLFEISAALCMLIDTMMSNQPQCCCWPVLSGTYKLVC